MQSVRESYSGQLVRRRHYLGVTNAMALDGSRQTRDQGRVVFDHELKKLRARLKALRKAAEPVQSQSAFWPISLS